MDLFHLATDRLNSNKSNMLSHMHTLSHMRKCVAIIHASNCQILFLSELARWTDIFKVKYSKINILKYIFDDVIILCKANLSSKHQTHQNTYLTQIEPAGCIAAVSPHEAWNDRGVSHHWGKSAGVPGRLCKTWCIYILRNHQGLNKIHQ